MKLRIVARSEIASSSSARELRQRDIQRKIKSKGFRKRFAKRLAKHLEDGEDILHELDT